METASRKNALELQFFATDPFFVELKDEPRLLAIAERAREKALAERRKLQRVGAPT
jgi:hypothetical protein